MASRIMHLAIADAIVRETDLQDGKRFRLGTILPDAYSPGVNTTASHLKTYIHNGTKTTYKLRYFRETYAHEMISDSLYLGYYIHLIQDILYRRFIYDEYKWDPMPEGNIERLHNDYRLLNTYLIEKHGMSGDIRIPDEIKDERLFDLYPFDFEQLKRDLQTDFVPYREGGSFFFTRSMADEYIANAASKCMDEMEALRKGGFIIDEETYAWNAHHR